MLFVQVCWQKLFYFCLVTIITSWSKALDKNGAKKMPSELASLLHIDASSLQEGEESKRSREATPALSKAPSTSIVQDLEERKLTVMFEFLMEQQQKRDEERGREAEDREKRDRLWIISLQEMKMRGEESRWIGKREGRKGKQREGNRRKMTEQQ